MGAYYSTIHGRLRNIECEQKLSDVRGGVHMYIDTYIIILLWIFAIFGFIYFYAACVNDSKGYTKTTDILT